MKSGDIFIDDRFEIPERLKKMTMEELDAEIERLEKKYLGEKKAKEKTSRML